MYGAQQVVELLGRIFRRRRIKEFDHNVSFKDGYLIIARTSDVNDECIGIAALLIKNIPLSLIASDDEELISYTRRISELISSLSAKISIILMPDRVDQNDIVRKIESELTRLNMLYALDQTNSKIKRKIELLERCHKRILTGERALKVTTLLIINENAPCSMIENRLRETLHRVKLSIKQYINVDVVKLDIKKLLGIPIIINQNHIMGKYAIMLLESNLRAFTPISIVHREKYHVNNISKSIYIGYDVDTHTPIFIDIDNYLPYHFIVIGPTGKGKTTLLALLTIQLIENKRDVVVIDFKGDLAKILTKNNIHSKHIDLEELINMNVNDLSILSKWFMELSMIFGELFGIDNVGKYNMYKMLVGLHRMHGRIYIDKLVSMVKKIHSSSSKLLYIVDLLNEFANKKNSYGVRDVYRGNDRYMVVSLKGYPEKIKQLISSLVLVKDFILTTSKLNVVENNNKSLLTKAIIIDEAWRLTSHSLSILSRLYREARGFGIGLVSSTQLVDDLPLPVIENAGNVVIFGYNSDEYVNKISELVLLTRREKHRLKTLGIGEALLKLKDIKTPYWIKIDASSVVT